jgi:RNA polymerase sigma factor (sigma-70 family)
MSGDLRVTVTVRNGALLRAMREEGFERASMLARAAAMSVGVLYEFLALKQAPIQANGEWRAPVLRLARVLRRLPEDLFPKSFLTRALVTNRVHRDINECELPSLMVDAPPSIQGDPHRSLIVSRALLALDAQLMGLTEKERRILEMRFGLSSEEACTYKQIAGRFGVSSQRIREIEAKALRRLRKRISTSGENDKVMALMAEGAA